jgi:hypothetical protein
VRDGAFPKEPGTVDIHQIGAAWRYEPAVAFGPNTDMLYAVHGDEDKLTTVDFGTRKTATVNVRPRLGWLERFLMLGTGVAYAKGMDGTVKQAVISPDGKYLYVVSTTEAYTKTSAQNWDIKITHGGLQVISVEDGSLVQQADIAASLIARSPDARYLLLNGWQETAGGRAWSEVYDVAANKSVKHLEGMQLMPTYRLDGTPAFVSIDYFSERSCSLASVNPSTWSVVSQWTGDCIGWLAAR